MGCFGIGRIFRFDGGSLPHQHCRSRTVTPFGKEPGDRRWASRLLRLWTRPIFIAPPEPKQPEFFKSLAGTLLMKVNDIAISAAPAPSRLNSQIPPHLSPAV